MSKADLLTDAASGGPGCLIREQSALSIGDPLTHSNLPQV